mmetsp:Transcript_21729/g.36385  ORF Transcript_21729/g.36385 Transcript_21729/m.36385 type:complete len:201 (+) Transcript_21729:72-674(+)
MEAQRARAALSLIKLSLSLRVWRVGLRRRPEARARHPLGRMRLRPRSSSLRERLTPMLLARNRAPSMPMRFPKRQRVSMAIVGCSKRVQTAEAPRAPMSLLVRSRNLRTEFLAIALQNLRIPCSPSLLPLRDKWVREGCVASPFPRASPARTWREQFWRLREVSVVVREMNLWRAFTETLELIERVLLAMLTSVREHPRG